MMFNVIPSSRESIFGEIAAVREATGHSEEQRESETVEERLSRGPVFS